MERGWKESGTEKAGSRERMWVVERGEERRGEEGREEWGLDKGSVGGERRGGADGFFSYCFLSSFGWFVLD